LGLPYFAIDRQPYSSVQERNDATKTTKLTATLANPSNTSICGREQREPFSSMRGNHSFHLSTSKQVGRGRGIHRTKPAWMTSQDSLLHVPDSILGESNISGLNDQKLPSSISLAPPAGRGRGIHRTKPAWMASQDSLLHVPDSILSNNNFSGLNDQKLPASTSLALPAGRGRGIHRTKPAWMTSQDSTLLHVPDRALSTLDVNAPKLQNSNNALKSCMKKKPKSTNTSADVAVKTEETELRSFQLEKATDMSCTRRADEGEGCDNNIKFSAKHKAKILSILPTNNGDNEGASMNFIRKTMEPCGLKLYRQIFELNLLDDIEIVDNADQQRRYFVRTAGSAVVPYKPWSYKPRKGLQKKSDAGGKKKSGADGGKNKKKKKEKDPNAPERPRTAYGFFTIAKQKETKEENPDVKKNKSIVSVGVAFVCVHLFIICAHDIS